MAIPYPRSEQKFRPRYPINPFGDEEFDTQFTVYEDQNEKQPTPSREPWILNVDRIPPLELTRLHSSVIVVVGAPTIQQLLPLCQSQHLSSSLLIIASYECLRFPPVVYPTVRVLRIREPLAVESSGAERLVRTLEWAERVGRVWRTHGGVGVSELAEPDDPKIIGDSSPTSSSLALGLVPGMSSSSSSLGHSSGTPSRPPSRHQSYSPARPPSSLGKSQSKPRLSKAMKGGTFLPPRDLTQRPFDVLINFLPGTGIPDGFLLKNAILVTTISRPFVLADESPTTAKASGKEARKRAESMQPKVSRPASKKRWSLFRTSQPPNVGQTTQQPNISQTSLTSGKLKISGPVPLSASRTFPASAPVLPSAVPSQRNTTTLNALSTGNTIKNTSPPLVIHVLPSPPLHPHDHMYTQKQLEARGKLVHSIEAFLLAFGSDKDSSKVHTGAEKRAYSTGKIDRARPYLVDGVSFANDVMSTDTSDNGGTSEGEWSLAELLCFGCLDSQPASRAGNGRVWLAGISDVTLSGAGFADVSKEPSPVESRSGSEESAESANTAQGPIQMKMKNDHEKERIRRPTSANNNPTIVTANLNVAGVGAGGGMGNTFSPTANGKTSTNGHSPIPDQGVGGIDNTQKRLQQGRHDWMAAPGQPLQSPNSGPSSSVSPANTGAVSPQVLQSSSPQASTMGYSPIKSASAHGHADMSGSSPVATSPTKSRTQRRLPSDYENSQVQHIAQPSLDSSPPQSQLIHPSLYPAAVSQTYPALTMPSSPPLPELPPLSPRLGESGHYQSNSPSFGSPAPVSYPSAAPTAQAVNGYSHSHTHAPSAFITHDTAISAPVSKKRPARPPRSAKSLPGHGFPPAQVVQPQAQPQAQAHGLHRGRSLPPQQAHPPHMQHQSMDGRGNWNGQQSKPMPQPYPGMPNGSAGQDPYRMKVNPYNGMPAQNTYSQPQPYMYQTPIANAMQRQQPSYAMPVEASYLPVAASLHGSSSTSYTQSSDASDTPPTPPEKDVHLVINALRKDHQPYDPIYGAGRRTSSGKWKFWK